MCLEPGAHVQARVYERLTESGVPSDRAMGVARKVRRAYEQKRRERRAAALDGRQPTN